MDVFAVAPQHAAIHSRLVNWARWGATRRYSAVCPMFRLVRHPRREVSEVREAVDTLDALRVEKAVAQLPEPYAQALRWWYVRQSPLASFRREMGLSQQGVWLLCNKARSMLQSRLGCGNVALA